MPQCLRFGRFELLPQQRQLLAGGVPVSLGSRAFDVLLALIEQPGRLVTKQALLERVWAGALVEEANVQVQVSALRKLLGADVVATIPGQGYRFTAVLEADDAVPPAAEAAGHATAIRHNLPQPRTRFIGREAALAACGALLDDARLLTITGMGGCGKTRLALQLVRPFTQPGHDDAFPDGLWFVDLAAVQEPQRLALSVAHALGVPEEAGVSLLDRLAARLAPQRTLIVLDNCEHLVEAAAALVDRLLNECAGVKIVATSREPLRVAGEQLFRVQPLSLPAAADPAAMRASEAVRLFVDRAGLVCPGFAMDERNAPAIGEVCRRLDGIALALELAAARVKMLPVAEIAVRLDDRFRFLVGGSRSLPRHEALHTTLQWSHDGLSEAEQRLFRELAVFAGGCPLDGAVAVATPADPGAPFDAHDVLELLTQLHDKSLLVVDRDDGREPRYGMLETVRQFAQDRLAAAGDAPAARDRHLAWCVALAEQAMSGLLGPRQGEWMARLQREQENLLAAHAWCPVSEAGAEAGLRLAASLNRYWLNSAQAEQGHRLALAALAEAGTETSAVWRCRTLATLGGIAYRMGRYDEAMRHAEQGLALAQAIDDVEQVVLGMNLRAKSLHATGRIDAALAQSRETVRVARTLGRTVRLSAALNNLAEIHRSVAQVEAAAACYEEAIALTRELQYPGGTFVSLTNLARLLIDAGQLPRSRRLLVESLALWAEAHLKGMGKDLLEITAALAAAEGQWAAAARLFGAASTRLQEAGSHREPVDEAFIQPWMDRARAALGSAEFAAAEAQGRGLGYDEAMADVRAWLIR